MPKKITSRFPNHKWYCVVCHECLSDQIGFNDNKFTWTCTHCKYRNSISKDNLREPYAYLINPTPKNRFLYFFIGFLSSIYSFIYRTEFYILLTAIIAIGLHRTNMDHLSLGMISPRGIEDYFCIALYTSGIAVIILLLIYALFKMIIGRPDTKKHFIRETLYFIRDNLLYPIKLIKSLMNKTTFVDKILSIVELLFLIGSIGFLVYGYLHLL